jgi:DNA repair exonuclease SbcCD ATPase subunit
MATLQTVVLIASPVVALIGAGAAWRSLSIQKENVGRQIDAQLKIAARQSRASVVSASRQRWIDAIRDDVAEFLSLEDAYKTLQARLDPAAEKPETVMADEEALTRRRVLLRKRIELRLNPAKEHHQALLHALDMLMSAKAADPVRELDVRDKTKALLKQEWERVKREATGAEPLSTPAET